MPKLFQCGAELLMFKFIMRFNRNDFFFRFYIGCDVCQDWFHGTCVGITQAEADFIENYVCPRCSSVNAEERIENRALSQKDVEGLKRLLRSLQVSPTL